MLKAFIAALVPLCMLAACTSPVDSEDVGQAQAALSGHTTVTAQPTSDQALTPWTVFPSGGSAFSKLNDYPTEGNPVDGVRLAAPAQGQGFLVGMTPLLGTNQCAGAVDTNQPTGIDAVTLSARVKSGPASTTVYPLVQVNGVFNGYYNLPKTVPANSSMALVWVLPNSPATGRPWTPYELGCRGSTIQAGLIPFSSASVDVDSIKFVFTYAWCTVGTAC
jgi:hypothetical protein